MNKPTPSDGSPPHRPPRASNASGRALKPEHERALLLRDVMEHSVRVEADSARPYEVPRSRAKAIVLLVLCVPLLGFSAYSWIARPEFIWGPRESGLMTPARSEANLRFAIYLEAQRVEMYRDSAGTYPTSLAAVGGDTSLRYVLLSDSVYRISSGGAAPIVLTSTDDFDAFLGDSPRLIQGGVR